MTKLSKDFYLASTVGGFALGFILTIVGSMLYSTGLVVIGLLLILIAIPMYIYSFVVGSLLVYRMWESIQDGYVRATPAKAVGFLFVPYFNLYWIFQALWGFSKDCNQYIDRHQVTVRKLPEGLSLAFCIVSLLSFLVPPIIEVPIIGALMITGISLAFYIVAFLSFLVLPIIADLIIGALLINRVCDTVNQLPQPSNIVPRRRSEMIGNNKSLHNYLARRWIRRVPELLLFNVFMGIGFLVVIASPFIPVTATTGWAAFTLAFIRATSNVLAIILLSFVYLDLLGWRGFLAGILMGIVVLVYNYNATSPTIYVTAWLFYIIFWVYMNIDYIKYKRLAKERIDAIAEEASPSIDQTLEKGILQQIILRQNERAIATLRPVLSVEGGDALLWYLTGVAFANMKMYSEALSAFDKAMEASPDAKTVSKINRSRRIARRRMR
ncbi:MAG: tetratricopeptide repeat protein [Dehalococcoidia bacterium]|jgi:hypothetical protein